MRGVEMSKTISKENKMSEKGNPVVVTTEFRGVFFGYVVSAAGAGITVFRHCLSFFVEF